MPRSQPDLHPTSAQVQQHLNDAIDQLDLPVKLTMKSQNWKRQPVAGAFTIRTMVIPGARILTSSCSPLASIQVASALQSFRAKNEFQGDIVTERDCRPQCLCWKKVLVAGFGKSALDMATFAEGKLGRYHLSGRRAGWSPFVYWASTTHACYFVAWAPF